MEESERQRILEETLAAHQGESFESQAEAIEQVLISEPSPPATDWLWKVLVGGLLTLLCLSLIGIVLLALSDKGVQPVVTIFASLLTGLLGLFVKGPR